MTLSLEVLNEVIRSRRSIFPPSYTDEEISVKDLEMILENANFAPTHRLTEPWRFTIFRGNGLTKLADFLGETYRSQTTPENFSEAKYEGTRSKALKSAAVIAIVMEVHPEKVPEWEELAAVACAVQNIWLTITAMGLGGYWSTPGNLAALGTFLNLSENQKCVGLFYLGHHAAPSKPAVRKPIMDKLTWIED